MGLRVKPNSGEALRDFADDVRGCLETLRAMNKVQEVDSQDRMIQILSRLPVYVQARWRQDNISISELKGIRGFTGRGIV